MSDLIRVPQPIRNTIGFALSTVLHSVKKEVDTLPKGNEHYVAMQIIYQNLLTAVELFPMPETDVEEDMITSTTKN